MAKHAKPEDNNPVDAQAKADAFDALFEESYERAEEKREAGEYPYDNDLKWRTC